MSDLSTNRRPQKRFSVKNGGNTARVYIGRIDHEIPNGQSHYNDSIQGDKESAGSTWCKQK